MNTMLMVIGAIIVACVASCKLSSKLGVPMLLLFILLGMFMGSDGIFKIPFDNYVLAEQVCSVALIFIMFYGGFGTKWSAAKPVAFRAILLSSVGTILTAALVGFFCFFVLSVSLFESFLIGAVISSTDAASVFSILRSKRLNLRYNTASLLEVESGSNDPFSYMLTFVVLALLNGEVTGAQMARLLFLQIFLGILFGFAIAFVTVEIMKRFHLNSSGFTAGFVVAIAIFAYSIPTSVGGNGYLSAYITGIVLGNSRIDSKRELVGFFDGATGLMQMVLFFSLGLLAFPSRLMDVAFVAMSVALFLTFVARPLAVFAILSFFKCGWKQSLLVSWAGLRGAASIVFSIMVVTDSAIIQNDVFHIVFFIVLYSILIQGTLLPFVAKRLDMTDAGSNVLHTFTDYIDETPLECIQCVIPPNHIWVDKLVRDLPLPPETMLVLLLRGKTKITPNGQIRLRAGDTLLLSGKETSRSQFINLLEKHIDRESYLVNKTLRELALEDTLVIMIKRQSQVIIPKGDTVVRENDVLVIVDEQSF